MCLLSSSQAAARISDNALSGDQGAAIRRHRHGRFGNRATQSRLRRLGGIAAAALVAYFFGTATGSGA